MKEFPLNKDYKIDLSGNVYNKFDKRLCTFLDRHDYIRIKLPDRKYYIHRMMAITYLPNPDNKPYVDHIDGNVSNNCLSNLRWATISENSTNTRPNAKKVEPNIYKYVKNYMVVFMSKNVRYRGYFKTLEEAREYKRSIIDERSTTEHISPDGA